MVIKCPNCQTKLKLDEKILRAESMFKCPKCNIVFVVKRPSVLPKKMLDQGKVLVAHSDPVIINEIVSLLHREGYEPVISSDGIGAILKAIKEIPFLAIVELELPKIYGFEVCRRVRSRPETKEMKFLFVGSAYAKTFREIPPICASEDLIEDKRLSELLVEKIATVRGIKTQYHQKSNNFT